MSNEQVERRIAMMNRTSYISHILHSTGKAAIASEEPTYDVIHMPIMYPSYQYFLYKNIIIQKKLSICVFILQSQTLLDMAVRYPYR